MAGRFFIPMRKVLNQIIGLDLDQLAFDIARTDTFKKLVISLNTEGTPTSQLFELGEDSEGTKLSQIGGDYSPFTVQEKQRKGQPTDRITLKDTGEFYRSFVVIPFKGGFRIEADTIKDDTDLEKEWGQNIIGLSPENIEIIVNFYKDAIQEKVNQRIKAA
jgi:hypothetical protein